MVNPCRLAQIESLESRRLLAADLVADFRGIYPTDAVTLNGLSLFAADDGVHGNELWRSDGSPDGTRIVRDLVPGPEGLTFNRLFAVGDLVLFFTTDASGNIALWRTDGNGDAGTVQLANFGKVNVNDFQFSPAASLGNRLIFLIHSNRPANPVELWTSDGTLAGTRRVRDLFTDTGISFETVHIDVLPNGRAIFAAGEQLWSTDGTDAGTISITDSISPGSITSTGHVPMGGAVYFTIEAQAQSALWRTDGTVAGTTLVKHDVWNQRFTRLDDETIGFMANNDGASWFWTTNGTAQGTVPLAALPDGIFNPSFARVGNRTLLVAYGWVNGNYDEPRLWLFALNDGEHDFAWVRTLSYSHSSARSARLVDKLDFAAQSFFLVNVGGPSGIERRELWRSDGTESGTALVEDLTADGINAYTDRVREIMKTTSWGIEEQRIIKLDAAAISLHEAGGQLAVKTPRRTLLFDPASFGALHAPNAGYVRLSDDGVLRIFGTSGADAIRIYRKSDDASRIVVSLNGLKRSLSAADVKRVHIYGYSGADNIAVDDRFGSIVIRSRIWAGTGDDTINTGSARDTIYGDAGDDLLVSSRNDDSLAGGAGDDAIHAGAGNDTAAGNAGADRLIGGDGNDLLSGGNDSANDDDTIDGSAGADVLFGRIVSEIFFAGQPGADPLDEILYS